MYLERLEHHYDINRFLPLLDQIEWDNEGRCSLNATDGHWLYDPYYTLPKWQGTEFDKFLKEFPYPVGETRLIKLEPAECYRSHGDIDDRYHLNLVASDQCFLVDLNNQKMHKIETDGYLYKMNGSTLHSAINFGGSVRIQLVMRIPLVRYDADCDRYVNIKFIDPPYNLRYLVDQHISPILNTFVKAGLLGFFDTVSPYEFTLKINRKALDSIQRCLTQLDLRYETVDKYSIEG